MNMVRPKAVLGPSGATQPVYFVDDRGRLLHTEAVCAAIPRWGALDPQHVLEAINEWVERHQYTLPALLEE